MYDGFTADNQGVRKLLLAWVVALSFPTHGGMQDVERWRRAVQSGLTREPVVGLLNLPDVVGDGCGVNPETTIPILDAPSSSGATLGAVSLLVTRTPQDACYSAVLEIRSTKSDEFQELPVEESGYEVLAAIVYQRSGNWFRIALQKGSGWIHRENGADFQPYPEMLTSDHLCHLQADWDGLLWAAPGEGTPKRISSAWRERIPNTLAVDVLELRRVGDRRWIRVRVTNGPCIDAGDMKRLPPVTGWLPVYGRSGVPNVWFYSRGC